MKMKIHWAKIVPTISEVELDEEQIIADFGYKEGLIDLFWMRESASFHYKVKKENWERCKENIRKYDGDKLDDYLMQNSKHIQSLEASRRDLITELELGEIDKENVSISRVSGTAINTLEFKDN